MGESVEWKKLFLLRNFFGDVTCYLFQTIHLGFRHQKSCENNIKPSQIMTENKIKKPGKKNSKICLLGRILSQKY